MNFYVGKFTISPQEQASRGFNTRTIQIIIIMMMIFIFIIETVVGTKVAVVRSI